MLTISDASEKRISQGTDAHGQPSPLLQLEHVSQKFFTQSLWRKRKTLLAVNDVSMFINHGETVGLVGESGCGKSTLGRLACGLLQPSEGHILLDGRPLPPAGAHSWATGRIQMIFQDPVSSLNPRLCVRSSIAEPLAAKHVGRVERNNMADAILSEVGLDGLGSRYPHEFSGGQRQRIAIARALITRPDLVICDEPVSALDASIQAQTLNLLRSVQERFGPAYLFISHDLAVVGFLCKRIIVMYLGSIVEEGSTEQIFTTSAHPYTQALLAAIPSGDETTEYAPPREGELPNPLSPPTGCHFHPRCPHAHAICRSEPPTWKTLAPGHSVRCWLV